MKKESDLHKSFINTYADAVVRFVVTGIHEDVSFDPTTQQFVAKPVDDDTPPSHCDFWIGGDWPSFVGPLLCPADLAHPKFSEQALKKAIVHALGKSATGKRMSLLLAGLD